MSNAARSPVNRPAVVRAHDWWNRLSSDAAPSVTDIARAEGLNDRYVRRVLELAFLDPKITTSILDGRQPVDLTADRLTKPRAIPIGWAGQRDDLGLD